jgi:phosphoserine phosphatase
MTVGREETPLCVDLDGTLIHGDSTWISLLLLARRRPWLLPGVPLHLLHGRARAKHFLASHIVPRPGQLPWRESVIAFVRQERHRRTRLLLTTGAHEYVATAVASHLGVFDEVIATDREHNRKGVAKLAAIRKSLGDNPFDFVSDDEADLPVMAAARLVYLVSPSPALLDAARRVSTVERVFDAD